MLVNVKTAQNRFLLIYVLWWVLWYFIADNMRVVHISSEATTAIFASITATVLGAGLVRLIWPSALEPAIPVDEAWIKTALRVYICVQFVILLLALRAMIKYGTEYRSLYFSDPGLIFGHAYVQMAYENGLVPLASYLLMRWLTNGRDIPAWYGYVAVTGLMYSVILNGRFGIYNAMFLVGVASVLGHRAGKKVWLGALIAVALTFAILYYRTGVALDDVNEGLVTADFRETVLGYHVVGFYVFDHYIKPHLIKTDFPLCNSLGILGMFIYGFTKYAFRSDVFPYCYGDLLVTLNKRIEIEDFGNTNAFGTNLLPFYVDGGLVLLSIVFMCAGAALFQRGRKGHVSPLSIQLLYLLVFGLFQPILNSAILVVPVLFHWATYSRKRIDDASVRQF
jgi:hypothetical protein